MRLATAQRMETSLDLAESRAKSALARPGLSPVTRRKWRTVITRIADVREALNRSKDKAEHRELTRPQIVDLDRARLRASAPRR